MRRHVLPVVALLVALLMARQIYPYASGSEPTVVDGYEVKRVAAGLGPTCLVWANDTHLLICDRDGGAITELNIQTDERRTLLNGLDRPHGLVVLDGTAVVSEAGKLTSYTIAESGFYVEALSLIHI